MKLEQAARQALDFCVELATLGGKYPYVNETQVVVDARKTSSALREALAEQAEGAIVKTCPDGYGTITTEQAEQEPVAWVTAKESFCGFPKLVFSETQKDGYKPLYAAPVRTKDLTDDEIVEIMKQPFNQREYMEQFARAVIAADREKNK